MVNIESVHGKNKCNAKFGSAVGLSVLHFSCFVGWIHELTRRAEASGQKQIFSCTNLQSMS